MLANRFLTRLAVETLTRSARWIEHDVPGARRPGYDKASGASIAQRRNVLLGPMISRSTVPWRRPMPGGRWCGARWWLAIALIGLTSGCASLSPGPLDREQATERAIAVERDRVVGAGWHRARLEAAGGWTLGAGEVPESFDDIWLQWWPDGESWMASVFDGNLDRARALAVLEQSSAQTRVARAGLLPRAGGSVGANRDQPLEGSGTQRVNLALSLDWDPDVFGGAAATLRATEARERAQTALLGATERQLIVQANQAALTWLVARESLGLAESSMAIAERTFELVRARREAGAVSGVDLALAAERLQAERSRLVARREAYQAATDALVLLSGRLRAEGDEVMLTRWLGTALPTMDPPVVPLDASTRLDRTPEVRVAQWQLVAAGAEIEAVQAAFYPELSLRAGLSGRGSTVAAVLDPGAWVASLAATLAQTVFDGGRRVAERDRAQARYRELLTEYRARALDALATAERQSLRVLTNREQLEIEQARLTAATRASELAELRYRAGLVDALTLLSAQSGEIDARERLLLTRLEALDAWLVLYGSLTDARPDTSLDAVGDRINAATRPAF